MTSTRAFVAPARTRQNLRPADGALHLIGDTHFGAPCMTATRTGVWANDLDRGGVLPDTLHTLVMGDLIDNGIPGNNQDAPAVSYMNQHFGAGNWHSAVGNHDFWGRPPDDAAAAWGMPAANYVLDFPAFRVIFIAPDALQAGATAMEDFTSTRLNWLNARLVETTKPCLIVCHWALYATVGALEPTTVHGARSVDTGCSATVNSEVLAVLAANPNAKAWLSGHTHSAIEIQGLVTPVTVGGHTLAAINCSAIAYTSDGAVYNTVSPIISLFATVTDDRIDVRFRDHANGRWTVAGPDRKAKWSVAL